MSMGKPMANYAAAKRVGDFVFMSGVVAVDPATRRAVAGYDAIPEEARTALQGVGYATGQMSVDVFEAPIVAQSWFEDAEHGIEVDGRLVTAPYTIDVIGDPDTLSKALDFPGGFKDDVALDHGTTQVRKLKRVHIDAVREAVGSQYAQSTQNP